jgi:hypothetical protein
MTKADLVVEIVGAPVTISDAQAHRFATQTYSAIRAYCEENHEAFLAWEKEQNKEDEAVAV